MLNNTLGNLSVAVQKRDRSLKNKSCDLHTTMDFGSVMPGKVQRIYPNSSFTVRDRERVLLTSLVRPCMARITLKSYHNFVPFSDLTRNYAPMMAQEPVNRGGTSFVPQNVPYVSIRELSLFVLFGAQMTIYKDYGATGNSSYADLFQIQSSVAWNAGASALGTDAQQAINDLQVDFAGSSYNFTSAARISTDLFFTVGTSSAAKILYLSNPTYASFFDFKTQHPSESHDGDTVVSLDGADYVIPVSVSISGGGTRTYLCAFRLSSFGRRLRKVLIGCGWQFDLSNTDPFSFLALAAYYKSYFDVFGLTLYKNWEDTYCYKLLQAFDLDSAPTCHPWYPNSQDLYAGNFRYFMLYELGMTFYTTEQDFVSSHLRDTAVSPSPSAFISSIDTSVDALNGNVPNISTTAIGTSEPIVMTNPNGHAFINDTLHGQLDSELLKRLYRQTNVNTVAGRRIAELLRAQGLGSYVDECKSNFIGSWELDLNIFDLPVQSDTYNDATNQGMRAGEFGAFGKSSGEHKPMTYETNEDGYYINLLVIVPRSGYSESIDPDATCISKYQQYNPEFDSLGMEFDAKYVVQGSVPWANIGFGSQTSASMKDSFGLVPRYFNKKFGRNVINGDFSLRSTRKSYLPFCLERIIPVNEKVVQPPQAGTNLARYYYEGLFEPSDFPIAGNVWRYLTRYDWIANFNRIFYNSGLIFGGVNPASVSSVVKYEYFSLRDDNFIVHMLYYLNVRDPMLPVQDSFETDDPDLKSNSSMGKA